MGKTDKGKGPENLFSVERVAQGWAILGKQAKRVSSGRGAAYPASLAGPEFTLHSEPVRPRKTPVALLD